VSGYNPAASRGWLCHVHAKGMHVVAQAFAMVQEENQDNGRRQEG